MRRNDPKINTRNLQRSFWNLDRLSKNNNDNLEIEKRFWDYGYNHIAGVDEVGRGCLAGPVVAAAVIIPKNIRIKGITDSKLLSPQKRQELSIVIKETALSYAIVEISPQEIDKLNILQASLKAMHIAINKLSIKPDVVFIDGNQLIKELDIPQFAITKGDLMSQSIGAASIIAKVYRDNLMKEFHNLYPYYNFYKNKGYATREHKEAIKRYGVCPLHRLSFNIET